MSNSEVLERLQEMTPREFEHFVADLWERRGWDTAEVSDKGADAGVDVVARKDGVFEEKQVIQAKRYSRKKNNKVEGPEVQQYASLPDQTGADSVVIVTTGRFTDPAKERANDLNVKTVDGDDILEMIEKHNSGDLVEEYAPTMEEIKASESPTSGSRSSPATAGGDSSDSDSNVGGVVVLLVILLGAAFVFGGGGGGGTTGSPSTDGGSPVASGSMDSLDVTVENAKSVEGYALVKLSIENTGSSPQSFPSGTSMNLVHNGSTEFSTTYDNMSIGGREYVNYQSLSGSLESGQSTSGWMIYDIGEEVSWENAKIEYDGEMGSFELKMG
ncbi:restriction endonuclease (plasmid) [Halorutilales archaeon Cl-col2-1]